MIVVADTSGILAAVDSANKLHQQCRKVFAHAETVLVTPMVLAETDYMLTTRFGVQTAVDFLAEVNEGACDLYGVAAADLIAARELMTRYYDLAIGLTDAMNVVAADRWHTNWMLTLDERHFRTVTPMHPELDAFRLLPFDD
ncbi:MAG: type II toxin-antitoxin system VapC family toxin [Stackebrandtia sp.]